MIGKFLLVLFYSFYWLAVKTPTQSPKRKTLSPVCGAKDFFPLYLLRTAVSGLILLAIGVVQITQTRVGKGYIGRKGGHMPRSKKQAS